MIPKIRMTPRGIYAPTRQEVTAGLWDIFQTAFGQDLNRNDKTPQGQLVTSLTAFVMDEQAQLIDFFNQVDPRYSQGKMQEAIGQIYFMQPKGAICSTAQLSAIGREGVTIPTGSYFIDDNGNKWVSTELSVINSDGKAVINVQAQDAGEIVAAPNTITTIPNAIDGLDSVTNPNSSTVGNNGESQVDFEIRRYESVAKNSKNTNSSVYGDVAQLANVVDVYVIDNPTDDTIQVGSTNYSMIRNSLLVSVVGGDGYSIAKAMLTKGGTGCSFVGNTEVVYKDEDSFNVKPPEYKVKFLRPSNVDVFVKLIVTDKQSINIQAEQALKAKIMQSFSSGKSRARIGMKLLASSFICGSEIPIVSSKVSTNNSDWFEYIDFGVDQFPVLNEVNIIIEGM